MIAVRWRDYNTNSERDGLLLQVSNGEHNNREQGIAYVITKANGHDTRGMAKVGDTIVLAVALYQIVVKGVHLPFDMSGHGGK